MLRTTQNPDKEECLHEKVCQILSACIVHVSVCVRVWCSRWRKEGAVCSNEAESGAKEIGRK